MNTQALARHVVASLALIAACTIALAHPPAPGSAAAPKQHPTEAELLAQGKASFGSTPAQLEVKKAKTGHLLVRPVVNGHEVGWFIFDTGAGICCITKGLAGDLSLERLGDIDAVGVGGGKPAPVFRAKELRLGPLTLSDHPLMELDLGFLDQHMGEKINGIIGFGVLLQCVAEIDLDRPAIALHDPAAFALPRGEWAAIDLKERVPVIEAKFEGRAGKFRLDTGDHTTVVFHAPATRQFDLLKGRETTDIKVGGVGGFLPAKRGTIASFEIGGERLENIRADFALEDKGTLGVAEMDGNIGTGILERFVLVLDYSKQRLALLKRE